MGNIIVHRKDSSKPVEAIAAAPSSSVAVAATSATPPAAAIASKPNDACDPPMAFAIMRNAHEAFRGAIKEATAALAESSDSFSQTWKDIQRAVQVHKDMEDIDMFPLLDSFAPGTVSGADLNGLHVADDANLHAVDMLLSAEKVDWVMVKEAFEIWKEVHLEHFEKEESVMAPITMKTAPTPEGRCKLVHEKVVLPALARNVEEFQYFIGFCVSNLCKHGSTQQPPNVATRVFVRALRSACLKIQWQKFMPVCKANCTADIWAELVDKYHMEDADDAHLLV